QLQQFESDRRQIRDVPVPGAARDSAISAALAVFDQQHAVPASPSNVVSLDSRRRWYRVVAGAAAALLVVVGGAAVLGSMGGSDDDSAATADVTASQKSGGDADATLDAPATADQAAPMIDAPDAAATEAASASAAPAATDAPAVAATSAGSDATDSPSASTPVSTIGAIPGAATATPDIDDQSQLATFVADAPVVTDASTERCVPQGDDDLGHVTYRSTPAVVARHRDDGMVTVYDMKDCTVLATLAS
ncbi:MAG: hypothetical protein JWN99_3296, partial [Ilumatobacteraceae bacterium]|nr:hypothetical protein [Ilumatobacteraceae bacterium]